MTGVPAAGEPLAVDVVLRDGATACLRPARPDDQGALLAFYEQLSPESRYFRFFGKPRVDAVVDDVMERIDHHDACTMVAEIGRQIVAVGQYFANSDDPACAEVAFAIADAHQGRGIGTKLLEHLRAAARTAGIITFDAYLLHENQRMRQLFADAGFDATWRRIDAQTTHVTLSLTESDALHEKTAARDRAAAHASLTPFFSPSTVAVVGASRTRGRIGAEIFHNLVASGFRGRLIPVNPSGEAIDGIASVPRVSAIDGGVSLAVIAIPCDRVPDVVDDCIAKGVKALLVISAGFGETGGDGRQREEAIVEKIRASGIRMIGPNCMGIIKYGSGRAPQCDLFACPSRRHPSLSGELRKSTDLQPPRA